MSAPNSAVADGEDAVTRLWQRIHVPVFFAKLAELGIRPQDDAEAEIYLKMGAKLHGAELANTASGAMTKTSVAAEANSRLDATLAELGLAAPAAPDDSQLLKIAGEIAARPDVAADLATVRRALGQVA